MRKDLIIKLGYLFSTFITQSYIVHWTNLLEQFLTISNKNLLGGFLNHIYTNKTIFKEYYLLEDYSHFTSF